MVWTALNWIHSWRDPAFFLMETQTNLSHKWFPHYISVIVTLPMFLFVLCLPTSWLNELNVALRFTFTVNYFCSLHFNRIYRPNISKICLTLPFHQFNRNDSNNYLKKKLCTRNNCSIIALTVLSYVYHNSVRWNIVCILDWQVHNATLV